MGSELIRDDLPSDFDLALFSDVHVGAKSYHDVAFREFVEKVRKTKRLYAVGLGDYIEGQTVDHPHFEEESVTPKMFKPSQQVEYFKDVVDPIADKLIGLLKGNHDWRFDKVKPFIRDLCTKELRVPYLGTRSHVSLNGLNFWLSHKGKILPKGAKDPIQRDANRRAALIRNLENHWGSAHLLAHGDTHDLLVAKPLPDPSMLVSGKDGTTRMRRVSYEAMGTTTPEGFLYTNPYSRYYAVTGTFRRSGIMQPIGDDLGAELWEDYGENFGYPPLQIGYVMVHVRKDRIVDAREVFC